MAGLQYLPIFLHTTDELLFFSEIRNQVLRKRKKKIKRILRFTDKSDYNNLGPSQSWTITKSNYKKSGHNKVGPLQSHIIRLLLKFKFYFFIMLKF